jgi:hypothetical protein
MQVQPGSSVPLPWFTLPLVTIMACVGKPRGHGRITFTSANHRIPPRIDSNFLSDAHDRARAVIVADASAMPSIPSSNTNLPTLMIGERCGAWIRDGDL